MAAPPLALVLAASGSHEHTEAVGHGSHYAILLVGLAVLVVVGFVQGRERPDGERADGGLRPDGPLLSMAERVVVPVAIVSSTAAAAVHAAVGPAHFEESALFGLFFVVTAVLQLVWAGALAVHRSRALLVLGLVGNLAVVALWALTRTVGLPFGLLDAPEAVGAWDLVCGAWEVGVAACCVLLLRSSHTRGQLAPWREWHRSVHVYVVGSVLLLGALTFSGASA